MEISIILWFLVLGNIINYSVFVIYLFIYKMRLINVSKFTYTICDFVFKFMSVICMKMSCWKLFRYIRISRKYPYQCYLSFCPISRTMSYLNVPDRNLTKRKPTNRNVNWKKKGFDLRTLKKRSLERSCFQLVLECTYWVPNENQYILRKEVKERRIATSTWNRVKKAK